MPSSVNRKKLRIVDPNARRRSAPISSNVQTVIRFLLKRQINATKKRFTVPLFNVVDAQINGKRPPTEIESSNVQRCRRVFRKISIRAVLAPANIARYSFFTQRRNFVQNKTFTNLARNANYTYFNVGVNIKKRSFTLRD